MTGNPKPATESQTIAVIWDMDGVIADTGPYHLQAWQKVFRKRGVDITADNFRHNFGQRNDRIVRNTLGGNITQEVVDAIVREKENIFRKAARQNIKPLPGAIKLMKSLKEYGFKIAIGSSAPIENIRLVTQSLGIDNWFQAIASGHEVTEGKPSPQGFLLAAKKLGVAPKNCIVIEDSMAGVAAAKKAGMHCIAVTNTHPRQSLNKADLIVDTLEEITENDLEQLLKSQ